MNDTLSDLKDDLHELLVLAEDAAKRLAAFERVLEHSGEWFRVEARHSLIASARRLALEYVGVFDGLRVELDASATWTENDIARLIEKKKQSADLIRVLQGQLGALLAAGDWQSPSFLHALQPEAGTQTGRIVGTMNDYKRDGHLDALDFENAFRKEYLDTKLRLAPHVFTTSSGMSAFATVLGHLTGKLRVTGPIIVGRNGYFENRILLDEMFPGKVVLVDEFDTAGILKAVRDVRPRALFLDSLCNTETIPMPDLHALIPELMRIMPKQSYLVLDNTGRGITYQALSDTPRMIEGKAKLIVIESLNKYYQFGMDRVTGGVYWTTGSSSIGLMTARVHHGTALPDASVLALPRPNRALLEKRMAHLGRNALALATRLETFLAAHPSSPIARVNYPGLSSYPGFAWTKEMNFHGCFFTLTWNAHHQNVFTYKAFINRVMDEARKRGADIVSGTSFGFSTTRVYLTALHATGVTKPFVRISVGTETAEELRVIGDVLESAML